MTVGCMVLWIVLGYLGYDFGCCYGPPKNFLGRKPRKPSFFWQPCVPQVIGGQMRPGKETSSCFDLEDLVNDHEISR